VIEVGGHFSSASGRTAVITGASSGIGAAFADRLARDGFNCVLVARRTVAMKDLARRLEKDRAVSVEVLTADLSSDAGIAAVERRISDDSSIDVLVNAAGFGTRGMFVETDPWKIESMIILHALATARLCRAALPSMIRNRRGWIINVSSMGAYFTAPHYVTYSATKSFITMLTRGLRSELTGTGVRAQALCPGLTRSEFLFTDEFKDVNYGRIPFTFWMSADTVARKSLAALRWNRAVVVPGLGNKLWVAYMKLPVIGPLFQWIMGRMAGARY
jgi:uncharacterized protein